MADFRIQASTFRKRHFRLYQVNQTHGGSLPGQHASSLPLQSPPKGCIFHINMDVFVTNGWSVNDGLGRLPSGQSYGGLRETNCMCLNDSKVCHYRNPALSSVWDSFRQFPTCPANGTLANPVQRLLYASGEATNPRESSFEAATCGKTCFCFLFV